MTELALYVPSLVSASLVSSLHIPHLSLVTLASSIASLQYLIMVFGLFQGSPKKEETPVVAAEKAAAAVVSKVSQEPGFRLSSTGCTALVTGSSGLCGARLVEMLLLRGAKKVIAFDVAAPNDILQQRFDDVQKETGGVIVICSGEFGNLCSDEAVDAAFADNGPIDVCLHIGALVGPFFDRAKYMAVNYHGTVRIINACKKFQVSRMVYSSSPSTRFTGADVTGETEDELPMPKKWLAMYAEAKAHGEMAVTKACSVKDNFLTVSVAPHQIYGPHDNLFLSNLLEAAGNGSLRIFGPGKNKISVCYVDNYCHGLLCGADALVADSPALAKFYIITDGDPVYFWNMLNEAVVAMGFTDLTLKWHLPVLLLYMAAYMANVIGFLTGKKLKLNPFNVKMLTIHRYFSIQNAVRDLKYQPVKPYATAWPETIAWFQQHWLPAFLEKTSKTAGTPSVAAPNKKED
jgi:nucleoside-diphosphate-sugar epimerase